MERTIQERANELAEKLYDAVEVLEEAASALPDRPGQAAGVLALRVAELVQEVQKAARAQLRRELEGRVAGDGPEWDAWKARRARGDLW